MKAEAWADVRTAMARAREAIPLIADVGVSAPGSADETIYPSMTIVHSADDKLVLQIVVDPEHVSTLRNFRLGQVPGA